MLPSAGDLPATTLEGQYLLFQGLGTDEETLIEILCSRSSEEMADIKKVYTESKCPVGSDTPSLPLTPPTHPKPSFGVELSQLELETLIVLCLSAGIQSSSVQEEPG